MITNLSGFPSSLTVIPIPDGDPKKHREYFYVNEDLKRLGCSGRAGLKLAPPSGATQAKFHQLYRTSEKIAISGAVLELVRLCQVALLLFGKLEAEYVDGLLCDVTEKAISDWWVEFGTGFYNIEPHDGILGPTTVAALLGMLMGARNRLNAYGAPVSKDVFNVETMKRGIAHFQRSQRLLKTRRLDHQTLGRLWHVTAKAASSEGWTMPRAVKSTVAELSGKGGEMVMEMVGAKDKAGIADIETVDLERFVDLVYGERPKWLWHGKPRKSGTNDMFSRLPKETGLVFQQDDQGGYAWKSKRRETTLDDIMSPISDPDPSKEPRSSVEIHERDASPKRTVLKKATGRISEARSGFGKIKDVVGRRNYQGRHSREEDEPRASIEFENQLKSPVNSAASPLVGYKPLRNKESTEVTSVDVADGEPTFAKVLSETPAESHKAFFSSESPALSHSESVQADVSTNVKPDIELQAPTAASSIAGSIYKGLDLNDILPHDEDPEHYISPVLRRTRSATDMRTVTRRGLNENRWPRHLSFSLSEERVLRWESINDPTLSHLEDDVRKQFQREILLAADDRRTRAQLTSLANSVGAWLELQLDLVQGLDEQAYRDEVELDDTTYYPRLDEYHTLRQDVQDAISQERTRMQDALKDVEVLGAKLEYEINALRSKVEDVEDGVAEYERQVLGVEDRVRALEQEARSREGWIHWVVRMVSGFGEAPGLKS